MQKFNQIVCIDNIRLTKSGYEQLAAFSELPVIRYYDYPSEKNEIINRIGNADCVLVSWKTQIDKEIIETAPNIKYIGMCCSLIDKTSANVHIDTAISRNIEVKGVKDYGDEGVIEFIFAEIISLAKGLKGKQWKTSQTELKGKTLGIIGFGTVGQMLSKVALAFGMKVLYYSRTQKPNLESENLGYADLDTLLSSSDIISTSLPRRTVILNQREFDLIKPNSIFINTSVGLTFEQEAFKNWIVKDNNFAIFDLDGAFGLIDIEKFENMVYFPNTTGMTDAAFERLSQKVIQNIEQYLNSN